MSSRAGGAIETMGIDGKEIAGVRRGAASGLLDLVEGAFG
jgi:hypothetical protein